MKKKVVEKKLRSYGWAKLREGSNHEIWSNGKGDQTALARHPDIPEHTAKAILKIAMRNPGNK